MSIMLFLTKKIQKVSLKFKCLNFAANMYF